MCTPNTHMHNKYISLNTVSFFCLCDHCLCIHIATLDIPPWSTAGKKLDVFDFSLWLRVSEERGGGGRRRERRQKYSMLQKFVFGELVFTIAPTAYCSVGKIQSTPDPLLHVSTPQPLHSGMVWIVSRWVYCPLVNWNMVAFSRKMNSRASR